MNDKILHFHQRNGEEQSRHIGVYLLAVKKTPPLQTLKGLTLTIGYKVKGV